MFALGTSDSRLELCFPLSQFRNTKIKAAMNILEMLLKLEGSSYDIFRSLFFANNYFLV